ncbi:unnamed protein product [Pseudo-nitzschia multistriata]|uniref:Uncharacterized protein n=1 Tax=Pseudo-nitzschia multistriata TaxID=183589 RepID=A0A448ZE72_9STRA|nr:unnamed protein product [Pseudo-nitzschia multistriata]
MTAMPMAPGMDPHMVAYFQAQQRLQKHQHQQRGQQALPPGPNNVASQQQPHQRTQGQPPRQNQQQPQQQQGQQLQQEVLPGRKPRADANVASVLLQLKTKQNGEHVPATEAEALRIQAEHQAALNVRTATVRGLPQMNASPQLAGLHGYPGAPVPQAPGPMPPAMGMNVNMPVNMPMNMNMYGYPGMVPFALPQNSMGGMPPPAGYPMPPGVHVPVPMGVAVGDHASAGQMVQGLNHAAPGVMPQGRPDNGGSVAGGHGTEKAGTIMTDAYIESLISDDVMSKIATTRTASNAEPSSNAPPNVTDGSTSAKDNMNVPLVVPKDRDLIPDALFVALGQMKPTRLQQSDRVGCYKTRQINFLGMCCKHCGGQPGFGRYFPNSVRSLAQTTTSQTILKHIGGKCRMCPPAVRKAVLELQRQQAHKDHMTSGRPRYGSRKIFFQRMWARLHGRSADGETAVVVESDVSPETARAEAKRANTLKFSCKTSTIKSNIINKTVPFHTTKEEPSEDVVRSPPSEVSNNNSDEEDNNHSSEADESKKEQNCDVVNIRLSIDHNVATNSNSNVHSGDKRKLNVTTTAATNSSELRDDERAKKLRISPIESVEV